MRAADTSARLFRFRRHSQRLTRRSSPLNFHPVPPQTGQTSEDTLITSSDSTLHCALASRKCPAGKLCAHSVEPRRSLWRMRPKPVHYPQRTVTPSSLVGISKDRRFSVRALCSRCFAGEFPPPSVHSDTPVPKLGIRRGFSQLTFAKCRR